MRSWPGKLERPTLEAYGGITLAVIVYVNPVHWWLQVILLAIVGGLIGDICFRADWFREWTRYSKLGIWLISLVLLGAVFWNPVYDQYKREQLAANSEDIRQLATELKSLSAESYAFMEDRQKQSPVKGVDTDHVPIDQWGKEQHFKEETKAMWLRRYGDRTFGDLAKLDALGIAAPRTVKVAMSYDPSIMASWLGAMGGLLLEGKTQEAIKAGPDDKLWRELWH